MIKQINTPIPIPRRRPGRMVERERGAPTKDTRLLFSTLLDGRREETRSPGPAALYISCESEAGEKLSPQSVRRRVLNEVDLTKLGVEVTTCKPVDQKLLVVVTNNKERTVLSNALAKKGFTVTEGKSNSKPHLIKITRVDKSVGKEELLETNWKQNAFLRELTSWDKINSGFIPAFTKGGKQYDEVTWVVQVSKEVRKILIDSGSLNILLYRCKVEDFIDISRCFHCQQYGHISTNCKASTHTCGFCAGEHNTRECPGGMPHSPVCANCQRMGLPYNHKVDDQECPAYKKTLRKHARLIHS
ncbi:hypothetical protein GE061_007627 [Apolygus lucorum]|uniref:CCHC-type domain-containing protein n=1 Tax=Apolygus lucorum TaxID=248454 RepID=A0A8S9WTZ9_APOLU|nr:hypothetical protein GE061_007627 [Apolygus lucorum]